MADLSAKLLGPPRGSIAIILPSEALRLEHSSRFVPDVAELRLPGRPPCRCDPAAGSTTREFAAAAREALPPWLDPQPAWASRRRQTRWRGRNAFAAMTPRTMPAPSAAVTAVSSCDQMPAGNSSSTAAPMRPGLGSNNGPSSSKVPSNGRPSIPWSEGQTGTHRQDRDSAPQGAAAQSDLGREPARAELMRSQRDTECAGTPAQWCRFGTHLLHCGVEHHSEIHPHRTASEIPHSRRLDCACHGYFPVTENLKWAKCVNGERTQLEWCWPALTKFDALPMNAHGLRRVHLDLPPTLLARADEVVE